MIMKATKAVSGNLKSTEEKVTEYSQTKDGITKTLRSRKVENGYILEVREDGYKQVKGCKEWYCANQTFISKEDPLGEHEGSEKSEMGSDDVDDLVNVKDKISQALKNIKF